MNYYERHLGDYTKKTSHLTLLEHGVLTRLLDLYYIREAGIPEPDAARLVGARSKDERAALAAVLNEFFELRAGVHVQHRCDQEIGRYRDKQAKAKASADARWSAQRSQPDRNANALPLQSDGNAPSNQSPVTTTAPKVPRGRGSRLPDDWAPSETDLAFAQDRGLTGGALADEVANFADHWRATAGQRGVKADWAATWRNWVRKADAFAKPAAARGRTFREADEDQAAMQVLEHSGGLLRKKARAAEFLDQTEIIDAPPTAGLLGR